MLEQVFVIDIVDLDNHVLEGGEEVVVEGGAQDRQDMSNVCLLESLAAPQRKDAAQVVRRRWPGEVETVAAAAAWPVLRRIGERFPRTFPLAEWPERRQAQWVERSALFNFPDVIAAELSEGPGGEAGLFLYSRSLFGWSDLGVNRRRVQAWVEAFGTALRGAR